MLVTNDEFVLLPVTFFGPASVLGVSKRTIFHLSLSRE
jgi:hypothetical protein